MLPLRLSALCTQLFDDHDQPVVLQGVNMYLEWYRNGYGASLDSGSSALDVPHLRRSLPAANAVRFVGLLWHDSVKASDGLECSTADASKGHLDPICLQYIDALIQQCVDAGLWVIIAARAKYAAGWSGPDVWSDHTLRRQMIVMWRFIAERYKHTPRIAGYEIMSEPRNKNIGQSAVTQFMREGCEAIHAADPRSLCVVGPRPYYKLWELSDQVLQPAGSNTLYTFDFFVPKNFVMSDSSKSGARFPSSWRCKVCCATLPLTTRMQTLTHFHHSRAHHRTSTTHGGRESAAAPPPPQRSMSTSRGCGVLLRTLRWVLRRGTMFLCTVINGCEGRGV